jgi:probable phosphoglycerate mutase
MLRFLFVRHGRTPWNVQGRVQGGGGLDEVGRAQAVALGERLSSEPISAIYASPALRARQTATAVARRHGLKVRQRSLLRDMDYGKIAGALLSDAEARYPGLVKRWRTRPDTVQFEGGDSLDDLRRRIQRFIRETVTAHGSGTVLAATHDSPVRVAASLALGIDDSHHMQPEMRVPLASLTVLEVDGGLMHLALRHDEAHLEGIVA